MGKLGVLIWRKLFESGDEKRLKQQEQDLSDLVITRDLPYIDDGERGHLFDLYRLPSADENAPVLINIHGGGLFASYKEVNVNFNYEWARLGYRVVSISYRRIPETTLWHQIDDVLAALRYLKANAESLGLNLNRCYLVGDSAGALLSLFALSISRSETLQKVFGIAGAGFDFAATGFISIMLDTQRRDLMSAIRNVVTDKNDRGKPYEKYLLNPSMLLEEASAAPLFLVTSEEGLIQNDTLKLDRLLNERGTAHTLLNFPKGDENKLIHVFSVQYPMYAESREVFTKMDAFFKENGGNA